MPIPKIQLVRQIPTKPIKFPLATPKERPQEKMDFTGKNPLDYAPIKYQLDFNNRRLYFSGVYEFNNYPVIFAYVNDGTKLVPRLLYYSQSHAIWRVAPAFRGRFAKAWEGYSCDLPPLLNMSLMQHFQPQTLDPNKRLQMENIYSFVNAFTENYVSQYQDIPEKFSHETAVDKEKPLLEIPKTELMWGILKVNAKVDYDSAVRDVGILPNLSSINEFLPISNLFYNQHILKSNLNIYSCLSYNEKYRYLIGEGIHKEGAEPMRFILSICKEPVKINSYCISPNTVYAGYEVHTPGVRAGNTLVDNILPMDYKPAFHYGPNQEFYHDITKYVLQLPLNDLLNHPEIMNKLIQKSQQTFTKTEPQPLPPEINYLQVINDIKNYLYNKTWHIFGMLYDYDVNLSQDKHPNYLPKGVKQQLELIRQFEADGNPNKYAEAVYCKIIQIALQTLEEEKNTKQHYETIQYYKEFMKSDDAIAAFFSQAPSLQNKNTSPE